MLRVTIKTRAWGRAVKRICIILGVGVLAGCANLTAVRDISSGLTKATSDWDDVGAELAASCQRETSLNPQLTNCDEERLTAEGVAGANAVLAAYFEALTAAATETNFTIQPGLDAATKSFGAIPNINKDRVNAVSGLAGLVAQLATAAARERVLRQLIEQGAPNAKVVVEGMDEVLAVPLLGRLDSEKTQLTSIYVKQIRDQKDSVDGAPANLCKGSTAAGFSGAGFLLAQDYCRRLAIIETREKAVESYRASLGDASKALSELQSSKTKLKAKDVALRLYKIGSDLDEKIDAVRKAFS